MVQAKLSFNPPRLLTFVVDERILTACEYYRSCVSTSTDMGGYPLHSSNAGGTAARLGAVIVSVCVAYDLTVGWGRIGQARAVERGNIWKTF